MLTIKYGKKFKQDYRRVLSRGYKKQELEKTINLIANEIELPPSYRDHQLENSRNYKGLRECHIQPNWLLIYRVEKDLELLRLIRTGTHSDLF